MSIFNLKNSIKTISYRHVFKICVLSGISLSIKSTFCFFPKFCLRCINFTIPKVQALEAYYLRINIFRENFRSIKSLRYFLCKNYLPCNGQRTKNNAMTCKRKRKKFLSKTVFKNKSLCLQKTLKKNKKL